MEFIATIIAAAFKSIWGVPVLILVIGFISLTIHHSLQVKNATGQKKIDQSKGKKRRKKLFDLKAGYWVFFEIILVFSIPITLFFGRHVHRSITEKYGVATEAVVYKISNSGIMLNYQGIDKYHFVFQLPDSTYQKASILEHHMQRRYGTNQRTTIKYLPLTASFYPIIIDIND